MAREAEGYRDYLELLNYQFPDCGMLTVEEVAQFLRICTRTVRTHFGPYIKFGKICKTDVARFMCAK